MKRFLTLICLLPSLLLPLSACGSKAKPEITPIPTVSARPQLSQSPAPQSKIGRAAKDMARGARDAARDMIEGSEDAAKELQRGMKQTVK